MIPRDRRSVRGGAALGCVLLATLSSGCLAFDTRKAHDSHYYEHHGMWCGNYGVGLEQARVATLTALTHLKMPVYQEGPAGPGIFIDTRTPENFEARVTILPLGRHEGTRIGIRIGGFGTHRAICEALLDEITQHLDAGQHLNAVPIAQLHPPPVAMPTSFPSTAAPQHAPSSEPSLPPQPQPVEKQLLSPP